MPPIDYLGITAYVICLLAALLGAVCRLNVPPNMRVNEASLRYGYEWSRIRRISPQRVALSIQIKRLGNSMDARQDE